jgi:hypothetical protein
MRRLRSSPARKFPLFPVFVRCVVVVVALHVAVRVCACGVSSDALDSGDPVYLHCCIENGPAVLGSHSGVYGAHHTVTLCPASP